jgi:hypothetical protein
MILKLTNIRTDEPVLIGTESVIQMNPSILKVHATSEQYSCTKIESRGAMVSTIYVAESVLEIWEMINKIK